MNMSSRTDFQEILNKFEGISLEEVNKASLMRRKDNKYLFSIQHLPGLLEMVNKDYRVLEIDGSRSQHYHTRYFDTDGREMYHKHHRGLANRHKVRIRRYGCKVEGEMISIIWQFQVHWVVIKLCHSIEIHFHSYRYS